ncbi:MAG TPA: pyridoxal phosphate-dependent aminotransferase [Micromonosporaceae bacterium]|jgi:N-succinyldiaminopimelate aminotransferase
MRPFGTTIFTEMSALAVRTDSINLGQGFPDTDGPVAMLEAAALALRSGRNQYPPLAGIPELRAAIAAHQRRFYGLEYDPDAEILVTAGATEAIAACVLGLCEPGDEVVLFEPFYDSYAASLSLAHATPRPVTLRPMADGRYGFDPDELRAAFSGRTKVVLLNSPHNPTGKVFTPSELDAVAQLCQEYDAIAVTDEVYEHLVFSDAGPVDDPSTVHCPIATLPGMRERTLRVSSGGKTFSCTGWKVGWVSGPAQLVAAATRVKQFLTFVNAGPLQPAIAVALGLPDSYFSQFASSLQHKRDALVDGLSAAGLTVYASEGTYFVTVDITPLGGTDGVEFCLSLPQRCRVVAIPAQVFYADPAPGRHIVRFAFCKRDEVIADAATRLRRLAA